MKNTTKNTTISTINKSKSVKPLKMALWASTLLLTLGSIATLEAQAQSGSLEIGIAAFKKQDYAGAITHWEQAANDGSVVAMYNLGRIYSDRKLNTVNYQRSIFWYEKAAANNHVSAMYNLGRLFIENNPEVQDVGKAMHYWNLAADNGSVDAMQGLASLYLVKDAPWHDEYKALDYLKMAAAHGDDSSKAILRRLVEAQKQRSAVKEAQRSQVAASSKNNSDAVSSASSPTSANNSSATRTENEVSAARISTEDEAIAATQIVEPKARNVAPVSQKVTAFVPLVKGNAPREVADSLSAKKGEKLRNGKPSTIQNGEDLVDPQVEDEELFDLILEFLSNEHLEMASGQSREKGDHRERLFEQARQAYLEGKTREAIGIMRALAEQGFEKAYIPFAQYEFDLENRYSQSALHYLSLAAQNNNTAAQLMLGEYLVQRPTDLERNRGWFWLGRAYAKSSDEYLQIR